MINNELCPNCGAPIINGQACEYCGYSASVIDTPKDSNDNYENPVLRRVLERALEIQKKHKKVIVDIMLYQHGCYGGYCIQCAYCSDGVGLAAFFKLSTPIHFDRLANLKEKKLFTYNENKYIGNYFLFNFKLDIKVAVNIITKLFVEVYDVNIESLGYHIWCQNSRFKDEFFDGNGNQIAPKPIQKHTRHPLFTSKLSFGVKILVFEGIILLGCILLGLLLE